RSSVPDRDRLVADPRPCSFRSERLDGHARRGGCLLVPFRGDVAALALDPAWFLLDHRLERVHIVLLAWFAAATQAADGLDREHRPQGRLVPPRGARANFGKRRAGNIAFVMTAISLDRSNSLESRDHFLRSALFLATFLEVSLTAAPFPDL